MHSLRRPTRRARPGGGAAGVAVPAEITALVPPVGSLPGPSQGGSSERHPAKGVACRWSWQLKPLSPGGVWRCGPDSGAEQFLGAGLHWAFPPPSSGNAGLGASSRLLPPAPQAFRICSVRAGWGGPSDLPAQAFSLPSDHFLKVGTKHREGEWLLVPTCPVVGLKQKPAWALLTLHCGLLSSFPPTHLPYFVRPSLRPNPSVSVIPEEKEEGIWKRSKWEGMGDLEGGSW